MHHGLRGDGRPWRFSTCGPRPLVGCGLLPGGPRPKLAIEKFFDVSHVSQSMKRYQVLVVELELLLHRPMQIISEHIKRNSS